MMPSHVGINSIQFFGIHYCDGLLHRLSTAQLSLVSHIVYADVLGHADIYTMFVSVPQVLLPCRQDTIIEVNLHGHCCDQPNVLVQPLKILSSAVLLPHVVISCFCSM